MRLKRRQFSKEFKLQVIREIEAGKPPAQATREHQLHPDMISQWRKQHEKYAERAFAGNRHAYTEEAKVAELERMVGQLTVENALLKKHYCGTKGRRRDPRAAANTGTECLRCRASHRRECAPCATDMLVAK